MFPSLAKRVMSHRYMSLNIAAPVLQAAKVVNARGEPLYTLHDFRHAAASLWIEQRVSPKRVQGWMGHSSIQVTFDIYGHLFEQAEQDASVATAIEQSVL